MNQSKNNTELHFDALPDILTGQQTRAVLGIGRTAVYRLLRAGIYSSQLRQKGRCITMTGSLQVKNDKYYAVLNFRDKDGKRVQKWIPLNLPLRGNKRKAETMLRQLIEQYQGLEAIEPINRLLGQHIADWVEHNRPKLAVTTYNQYVNILNLHLIPYFNPRGSPWET